MTNQNPNCQGSVQSIECDTTRELFTVKKIWGGRKTTVTECLNHAVASEQRGQTVNAIRD